MHGLNWQDFGARWLDNVRMQWTTMDPLCEKYYAISPYTYCSDDPAKNIDPDGKQVSVPIELFPYYLAGTGSETIKNDPKIDIATLSQDVKRAVSVGTIIAISNVAVPLMNAGILTQSKTSPGFKEQQRNDKKGKETLDGNQANMTKTIKENTPSSSPDPIKDEGPKRPINEWGRASLVGVSIGLAAALYQNLKQTVIVELNLKVKQREQKHEVLEKKKLQDISMANPDVNPE